MNSPVIFIVTFVCILLLYKDRPANDNKTYWLAAVLISALVAVRDLSVPDTIYYYGFYQAITPGDFSTVGYYSFEIGFQVYTHFLKIISLGSSVLYFFLISMTNLTILYFVAKKISPSGEDCNYLLLLLTYYAFFGFFYNAIVLRAGIAISLVLLAISLCYHQEKMDKRAWLQVAVTMLLALSFHYSSVIGLIPLLIFVISRPLRFELYMGIWFVLTLALIAHLSPHIVKMLLSVFLSVFSILSDSDFSKYTYYITELYELNPIVPYRIIFQFFICLLFINVKHVPAQYYKLLNIYMMGLFLAAMFYSIEQLSRVTDYFLVFSAPLMYLRFRNTYNQKSIMLPLVAFIYLQIIFFIRII